MDVKVTAVGRVQSQFSYRSILRWEFAYMLILLLLSSSGAGESLKVLANVYALVLELRVALLLLQRAHRLDRFARVVLCSLVALAIVNLTVNAGQEDLVEGIKIFSIFMFYFAGETTDEEFFETAPGFPLVALFVALPVFGALIALYTGHGSSQLADAPLSFFANRNNAVAFTVISSWTLMLVGVRPWLIVGYLVCSVIAFKTLGALVAIALAIYFIYIGFNFFRAAISVLAAAALYLAIGQDLEILSRATSSWRVLGKVLAESGGLWGLSKMDYAEIYMAAGTHDISLIFRLKHWLNLLTLYADGPLINQIFGFGVSSSVKLTEMTLLPHNDYIRFFFELGPGIFLCFIAVNLRILRRIGAQFIVIPAGFLFIYFFSDNLVNNFLVMSFFYFVAGALVARQKRLARTRRATVKRRRTSPLNDNKNAGSIS